MFRKGIYNGKRKAENGKRFEPKDIFRFPFFVMNRSWYPILLVAALLGLLILLAGLQYHWLGKISDGERERLQKRLEIDTERFAEDYNREIQNAYFNFQLDADAWREKNWNEFNQRLDFWRGKTAYPNLIKDFYFVQLGANETVLRYDNQSKTFDKTDWTENLKNLKPKITAKTNFQPIAEEIPALLMPVHDAEERLNRIIAVRTGKPDEAGIPPLVMLKRYGVLVIELDASVIKNQLFPDLVKKYFSDSENANYKLAVTNGQTQTVFQTENLTATDTNINFFNLSPDNFIFFANRDLLPAIHSERKSMIVNKIERTTRLPAPNKKQNRVEVEVLNNRNNEKPRVRVFESENLPTGGVWTLNVQHAAGSLEQFITNTRRKNLAISFGILSLLGASVILIFLSAQRAKQFAQKQIDFVSAVSHEFRTPLAVIYSAGENLTDGVVRNEIQISKYGDLIKREGKKLSAMVEQILEFAGARSGKRKYDFRQTDAGSVVENALRECQPLIEEKGFTVEKYVAGDLPKVSADFNALSHSVQNLINNSVKYGDGSKWIKISAENGDGKVKIVVEDKGIGISGREIAHIFEPFYRSKRVVDEQIHGNGLGLSLVKQTVEAHGGKVFVESEVGKGSRFTIELPGKEI